MKKGDCFIIAGQMVIENKDYVLCHGKVAGQGKLKGQRIGHAWIEFQDIVIDNSNGNRIVMRKERYYKIAKIEDKDVKKYPHEKALKLLFKYKHWGEFAE